MKDKTHTPRKIPYSTEKIEVILSDALEHSSHGWAALERETQVNRLNPESWPPQVEAEVGSAQYHLSVTITLLFEAYQSILTEREHIESVMKKVNRHLDSQDGK